MRIAAILFTLLLLAFSTLAGSGCKRTASADFLASAGQHGHLSRLVQGGMTHPLAAASLARRAAPSEPAFVFCHPQAGQLADSSLSAAAAQVVLDLQANNDDRTEMIAADISRTDPAGRPQVLVPAPPHTHAAIWLRVLLQPPRLLST